ncbi:hypothetical protein DIPPA_09954 [Diplonema papillatum]|nr:hypothetical protein DIPPA_09954 [Diplonema papillatum]
MAMGFRLECRQSAAVICGITGRGWTPLRWAVENRDEHTLRLLVDLGADASLPCRGGVVPLRAAVASDWHRGVQLLAKTAGAGSILRNCGDAQATSILVSSPGISSPATPRQSAAVICGITGRGWTPLRWAVENRDEHTLRLLVDLAQTPRCPAAAASSLCAPPSRATGTAAYSCLQRQLAPVRS